VDCLGASIRQKDELLARARRWAEQAPGPASYRALALALAVNWKMDEALEKARRAFEMEPSRWNRCALADILLAHGDDTEAEALVRPVVSDASRPPGERVRATGQYAAALAVQGRRREALQARETLRAIPHAMAAYHETRMFHFLGDGALDRSRAELNALVAIARAEGNVEDKPGKGVLVVFTAAVGDLEGAAVLARLLEPGSSDEALYRGIAAWRSKKLDESAAVLRPLSERDDGYRIFATYLLGEIEAARGRPAEALVALERFQHTFSTEYWKTWAWPRSQVVEAESLAAMGRRVEAQEEVQKFLEAWKNADPDLPLLAEARTLRARLAAAPK
jgi:tetratricopeptide (TPR) repeat protein